MVYHPNEFETAVTLGQNEPLYCNVPDSLSESLARARLPCYGPEESTAITSSDAAITRSDAARDNEDIISISSNDSVSVELESNNSHSSSEIESSTPYSGDFQPPADSAMSAERFDCVALCCANMDKPF